MTKALYVLKGPFNLELRFPENLEIQQLGKLAFPRHGLTLRNSSC